MSKADNSGVVIRNDQREKDVLGSLIAYPSVRLRLLGKLRASFFWDAKRRITFEILSELSEAGTPVDDAVILDRLEQRRAFSPAERDLAAEFVEGMTWGTDEDAAIDQHVETLRSLALRRGARSMALRLLEAADDHATLGMELVDTAQREIAELALDGSGAGGLLSPADIILSKYGNYDQFLDRSDSAPRVSTGLDDLDGLLGGSAVHNGAKGGLKRGSLIVLAARPSMGKSALALNIARNAVANNERVAAIFSLEMTRDEVLDRLVAADARIDLGRLERGETNPEERVRIGASLGRIANILTDETGLSSVASVRSAAYRVKAERGRLDLLVIDYLQLMQGDGRRRAENRVQEVANISRAFKLLAKELDVPVVLLSQLSRECEKRTDKRPMLADLRDSGSIEQDADVVAFLYREEQYDREKPELKGKAELDVAKNRNGQTGRVELAWVGRYQRFANLAKSAGQAY